MQNYIKQVEKLNRIDPRLPGYVTSWPASSPARFALAAGDFAAAPLAASSRLTASRAGRRERPGAGHRSAYRPQLRQRALDASSNTCSSLSQVPPAVLLHFPGFRRRGAARRSRGVGRGFPRLLLEPMTLLQQRLDHLRAFLLRLCKRAEPRGPPVRADLAAATAAPLRRPAGPPALLPSPSSASRSPRRICLQQASQIILDRELEDSF